METEDQDGTDSGSRIQHAPPVQSAPASTKPGQEAEPDYQSSLEAEQEINEFSLSREDAVLGCREDLDFLASICVPEMFRFPFPGPLLVVFQLLKESLLKWKTFERFAIGLPRGHAKTTVIKLLCLWTILFSKKKFILVICATDDAAVNIISDVFDMLGHPNMRKIFGHWEENIGRNTGHLKQFWMCGRQIMFAGIGINSSIRGLNLGNARPDFMIFDDAQTRDVAIDPVQAKEFRSKMYGTFLKLKSPDGCTYAYIGNMYKDVLDDKGRHCCMLRHFKDDPYWVSFITGAILADKQSLWPELYSYDQLLEEYRVDAAAGEEETWFAEVQNDPEALTSFRVDTSAIRRVSYGAEIEPEGACIIIDPATDKKGADNQVFTQIDINDGDPVIRRTTVDNSNPKKFIYNVLLDCVRYQIPCIGVESVAYQSTLKFWFDEFIQQLGLYQIRVVELPTGGIAKHKRIMPAIKAMVKGEYALHDDCYSAVVNEAAMYDPLERDNIDDILDTIGYIPRMLTEHRFACIKPLNAFLSATTDAPADSFQFDNNNILGVYQDGNF